MRGSAHVHFLIWIKNAPKMSDSEDKKILFLSEHMSARLPTVEEDSVLRERVL